MLVCEKVLLRIKKYTVWQQAEFFWFLTTNNPANQWQSNLKTILANHDSLVEKQITFGLYPNLPGIQDSI